MADPYGVGRRLDRIGNFRGKFRNKAYVRARRREHARARGERLSAVASEGRLADEQVGRIGVAINAPAAEIQSSRFLCLGLTLP